MNLCPDCERMAADARLLPQIKALFDRADREAQRAIIPKLCDEGLSYREVAELTGYSVAQVVRIASDVAGTMAPPRVRRAASE